MALPAWVAAIVQVPAAMPVTVLPDTLHTLGVLLAKFTGLFEPPPVAVNVPLAPADTAGDAPKVIACVVNWLVAAVTVILTVAVVTRKFASAALVAVMVQDPAVTAVKVDPLILQLALLLA